MQPIVTVECIDTLDPKVVRVTITLNGTVIYVLDIPQPVYNPIGLLNGWPTDPCG